VVLLHNTSHRSILPCTCCEPHPRTSNLPPPLLSPPVAAPTLPSACALPSRHALALAYHRSPCATLPLWSTLDPPVHRDWLSAGFGCLDWTTTVSRRLDWPPALKKHNTRERKQAEGKRKQKGVVMNWIQCNPKRNCTSDVMNLWMKMMKLFNRLLCMNCILCNCASCQSSKIASARLLSVAGRQRSCEFTADDGVWSAGGASQRVGGQSQRWNEPAASRVGYEVTCELRLGERAIWKSDGGWQALICKMPSPLLLAIRSISNAPDPSLHSLHGWADLHLIRPPHFYPMIQAYPLSPQQVTRPYPLASRDGNGDILPRICRTFWSLIEQKLPVLILVPARGEGFSPVPVCWRWILVLQTY
jgi:hypothetical protein